MWRSTARRIGRARSAPRIRQGTGTRRRTRRGATGAGGPPGCRRRARPYVETRRTPELTRTVVAALALVLRIVNLGHTPYIDELYHMLASHSLLTDGTLLIPGGDPYDRAWGFTYAVAAMQRLFGETLVVGRSVAVVAGTGLVVTLFAWIASRR